MKPLSLYIAVWVIVLLSFDARAQNIVPNASFEAYSTCPSSYAQMANCIDWRQYTAATSDYFNSCNAAELGVPLNKFGYQHAASGSAYGGIITYDPTGWKEYIACAIPALRRGAIYQVSMSVSLADSSGFSTADLGVWFYNAAPSSYAAAYNFLPVTPQVSFASYGSITDTANWVRLRGSFIADSAYTNMVIGGFASTLTTLGLVSTGHGHSDVAGNAYYFIDSVVIGKAIDIHFPIRSLCVGDTMVVPYDVYNSGGYYSSGNIFKLQLSDAAGSFAAPIILDTIIGNSSDTFRCAVPAGLVNSNNYRIRIVSTSNVDSSNDNGADIVIGNTKVGKPVASNNGPVCTSSRLLLTATNTTSGIFYAWTSANGFTSNLQNPSIIAASTTNSGDYIVTAWLYGCVAKDTTTVIVLDSVTSATVTSNSPVCEADTLKLFGSTTGGNISSFRWSGPNGFTSSARDTFIASPAVINSGNYTLAATATAGCIASNSINVIVKPIPHNFSSGSNTPLCQNSTLNLSGNTSSTGVTFSWTGPGSYSSSTQSPSISNAQPTHSGSYILTATLNGCTLKDTEVVNVIAIPAVPTPTANTPVCVSQALNLNAGGSGPGYLWSGPAAFVSSSITPSIPNATSAVAGVYAVKAIDGGCESAPATVTVTVIPKPTANAYPSPKDSICEGTTVTFNASSSNTGAAPGYKWFRNGLQEPGAFANKYATIPLADYDEYYCMVTTNGTCATPFSDTSNHIIMRVFPWLPASVSITSTATGTEKGGDLITFNATPVNGGNFPKYQWKRNNKDVVGALSYTWGAKTLDDKDVVCVEMSSSYLCPQPKTAKSNCITVSINTTGIDDNKLMQGVSIYPNPVYDELVIEGIAKGTRIQLFDVLGRVVIDKTSTGEKTTANTSLLTKGNYLLLLTEINGNRINARVVKE